MLAQVQITSQNSEPVCPVQSEHCETPTYQRSSFTCGREEQIHPKSKVASSTLVENQIWTIGYVP